jgi:hypothetical protein
MFLLNAGSEVNGRAVISVADHALPRHADPSRDGDPHWPPSALEALHGDYMKDRRRDCGHRPVEASIDGREARSIWPRASSSKNQASGSGPAHLVLRERRPDKRLGQRPFRIRRFGHAAPLRRSAACRWRVRRRRRRLHRVRTIDRETAGDVQPRLYVSGPRRVVVTAARDAAAEKQRPTTGTG